MCCHWIIKPKFNDVCVLFKHSNFCSRMLEMHSVHSNFSRNSCLQILSKTLYCVAMKQQIRGEKTKPQKGKPTIFSLWFWDLLACLDLYCEWSLHNQHSWNFSGVHCFLRLTVKRIASESEKKALKLSRKGELFWRQKLHVGLGMIIDVKNHTDLSGCYLHNFSYHIWLIQQWQLYYLIVQFESVTASE